MRVGRWLGRGSFCTKQFFHPHKPLHPSFWTVSGFKVSAAPLPCSDSNRPWERVEKHELLSRKYIQMAQQQGLCDMRYRLRRQTGSCTSGHCLGKDSGQPGQHPPPPAQPPRKQAPRPPQTPASSADAPRCRCLKVAEVSVQPQVLALQAVGSPPGFPRASI